MTEMQEYFEPRFVEQLFDKMSSSYARMNYITSFGFSERWRRKCIKELKMEEGKVIADLMAGMGECWKFILKNSDKTSKLIGLDFSTEMIERAKKNKEKFKGYTIEILQENIFNNSIENESVDYVVSGFGLKTFNDHQLEKLAEEIERILKPSGRFSLVDVSIPKIKILKCFYIFYLKNIIPLIGKIFLENPEVYQMLGVYTQEFKNSRHVEKIFRKKNFYVDYIEYFYGCASGIKGHKIR